MAEREIIANASLGRISPRTGYKITHFISISPPETEKSYEKFSNCLEILEIMPVPRSVRSNVLA